MGAQGVDLSVSLACFSYINRSSSDGVGPLGYFLFMHYFQKCDIKNTDLTLFTVFTGHAY